MVVNVAKILFTLGVVLGLVGGVGIVWSEQGLPNYDESWSIWAKMAATGGVSICCAILIYPLSDMWGIK